MTIFAGELAPPAKQTPAGGVCIGGSAALLAGLVWHFNLDAIGGGANDDSGE